MTVTGIVAALTAEARTFAPVPAPGRSAVAPPPIHTLADGSLLVISGMGPQAATRAAQALLAAGAQGLLSFGLAGALDPTLAAGALLLPAAVTDGTAAVHPTYAAWREHLAACAGGAAQSRDVTLLSVAQPLTGARAKAQAFARTRACAVDMESFAIARVAVDNAVNFAIARVVVDTAQDSLPGSVTRATDAYGEVDYLRLLGGLACAPVQIAAVLRLSQRYRVAMQALRRLAQSGVGSP